MDPSHIVELRGVAKLYGRTVALRALDLTVDRGEILAVLGPNGSGKTTLLKIIAGALAPTLGSGRVLGRDIRTERAAIRHEIGLLSGETYLYDDLTAQENLRFIGVMAGLRPQTGQIAAILDEVGLAGEANGRVRGFSSGMRRRLGLGRLLLLDPSVLLLDEPYNSLDAEAAGLVDAMVRRASQRGAATVLATHDADRANSLAQRVALMERGALIRIGPAHAVRSSHVQHVG
jgi:heme ABC exporter ATP-binding subunit CcmA